VKNQSNIVPVIQGKSGATLSKLQKDFNTHIKRINTLKEQIELVKKQLSEIQARVQKELVPLEQEECNARIEYVKALIQGYEAPKGLSKRDKDDLLEAILGELLDMTENFDRTDLIELYNQYNYDGKSYEDDMKEAQAHTQFKDFASQVFGLDLETHAEDEEMDDFERLHRMKAQIEEQMREQQWQEDQRKQNRKKTAKQIAKEQAMKEEAAMLNKNTRVIYTELAKEIHPDLETDETQKAWKTELMQKITDAYNREDLYELLRLQLEYQNSTQAIDTLPEERLKMYVKVLKEQVKTLQQAYHQIISPYNPEVGRYASMGLGGTKSQIDYRFRAEKKEIRERTALIYSTALQLKDSKALKEYLKNERRKSRYNQAFELEELILSHLGQKR
jgi:hypothetical protein